MIGAAKTYYRLTMQLLIEREVMGGALSDEDEARFIEELDRCWFAMTPEEQEEAENAPLDVTPLGAPTDLQARDAVAVAGSADPPRRAA